MQAIYTKYLPATNTRGSRIKATCDRGSITVSYPDELGPGEPCHVWAAGKLCEKFCAEDARLYGSKSDGSAWARPRIAGGLPSGMGWAHVFVD